MKRWKRFLAGVLAVITTATLLFPTQSVAYAEEVKSEEIAATSVSSDTDVAAVETLGRDWIIGDPVGEAYLHNLNSPMPMSDAGDTILIEDIGGSYYANTATNIYYITNEADNVSFYGYCAEPSQKATTGYYTVSILDTSTQKAKLIKAMCLIGYYGPLYDVYGSTAFSGFSSGRYGYTHAAIGYWYGGDTKGFDTKTLNWCSTVQAQLLSWLNDSSSTLAKAMDEYTLYVAYNDNGQDIVWVEKDPVVEERDIPYLSKSVSTLYNTGEDFSYSLRISLPELTQAQWYSEIIISDLLPPVLELAGDFKVEMRVVGQGNVDITSWFKNIGSGNDVIIYSDQATSEAECYDCSYVKVTIPVRPIEGSPHWSAYYLTGSNRRVWNSASLTVRADDGYSNTTHSRDDVFFRAQAQVNVVNGTYGIAVSDGEYGKITYGGTVPDYDDYIVPVDEDVTFSFAPDEGYTLESITVDGVAQDVSDYGDEFDYVFENIFGTENHIVVVYKPNTTGSITISKVDTSGQAVIDVGFQLDIQDASGTWTEVAEGTTDESGCVQFSDLLTGTYRVVETSAGEGLSLLAEPFEISISDADLDVEYTVVDQPILHMPHTGGVGNGLFLVVGFLCLSMIAYLRRKVCA